MPGNSPLLPRAVKRAATLARRPKRRLPNAHTRATRAPTRGARRAAACPGPSPARDHRLLHAAPPPLSPRGSPAKRRCARSHPPRRVPIRDACRRALLGLCRSACSGGPRGHCDGSEASALHADHIWAIPAANPIDLGQCLYDFGGSYSRWASQCLEITSSWPQGIDFRLCSGVPRGLAAQPWTASALTRNLSQPLFMRTLVPRSTANGIGTGGNVRSAQDTLSVGTQTQPYYYPRPIAQQRRCGRLLYATACLLLLRCMCDCATNIPPKLESATYHL